MSIFQGVTHFQVNEWQFINQQFFTSPFQLGPTSQVHAFARWCCTPIKTCVNIGTYGTYYFQCIVYMLLLLLLLLLCCCCCCCCHISSINPKLDKIWYVAFPKCKSLCLRDRTSRRFTVCSKCLREHVTQCTRGLGSASVKSEDWPRAWPSKIQWNQQRY